MPLVSQTVVVDPHVTAALHFSISGDAASSSSCTGECNNRPRDPARAPRQETGQWEWICYVAADIQLGANAMLEMS